MNVRRCLIPRSLLCVLALGLLGLALGCSKATPTAPSGATLAITANPSRIDVNGTSNITVFGQKPNGSPLDPGTVIRFSTDKGTIDAIATISNGQASALLHGDGTSGTATVSAATGSGSTSSGTGGTTSSGSAVTIKVLIGPAHTTGSIQLQATPTSIGNTTNSTVTLLAVVRDEEGQPLPGAQIDFQTDLGTLASKGALVTTDANGQATDLLSVKAVELTTNISSFMVRAEGAGAMGGAVMATATITVRTSAPVANFTYTALGNSNVQFTNLSTGSNLTYSWTFGDSSSGSTDVSPQHQYPAPGTYTVTLVASSATTGQASTKTEQVVVK